MKINNGENKIFFSNGKLFLNDIQIAGEGIIPQKDILITFNVKKSEEKLLIKDPAILEVNVHDSVSNKDVGPGQK